MSDAHLRLRRFFWELKVADVIFASKIDENRESLKRLPGQ